MSKKRATRLYTPVKTVDFRDDGWTASGPEYSAGVFPCRDGFRVRYIGAGGYSVAFEVLADRDTAQQRAYAYAESGVLPDGVTVDPSQFPSFPPMFLPGELVRYNGRQDGPGYRIESCAWRPYEQAYYYKVDGRHWSESSLEAVK